MAIPKRLLTRSMLKRARESGEYDAETLAWFKKKVKNEVRRKKRKAAKKLEAAKKLKHRLFSQPVTGDPAFIALTSKLPMKAYKKKLKAEKLANEERKDIIEIRKLMEAGAAIIQRATQPKPKRRSPRTGLARFGLSL